MILDAIELFHVAMPLVEPWRTAYGEDWTIESVLVRAASGALVAWSETSPLAAPCYSPEYAGGVFAVLRDWLAPAVLGRELPTGAAMQQCLAVYKGNPFAKAALDNVWWALEAARRNLPLHRLLGATRDRVLVGADFGVEDTIAALLAKIAAAVEAGFPRVKLKFRPGWDLPMVAAVRREFPALTMHVDCNSGYTLADVDVFRRLDEFGLAMIEQPLAHDDVVDHAALQKQIATPICLDESINSVARARAAIALGSCRYVNIKPGRVGGLTNALAIYELCRDAGIPCWVGGMLESAVGARTCVALAMLDHFTYPGDIFPSRRFYREDLSEPELELTPDEAGRPWVVASEQFGAGATPNPQRLKQWTKAHAVVGQAQRA
jgi:O-succinylbenzoate synthase